MVASQIAERSKYHTYFQKKIIPLKSPITDLPASYQRYERLMKIYERLIYNQLSDYAEGFSSNVLCGFRKAHSTHSVFFI